MEGWIKIHRKIIEWEWFEDHNTFRLFMYLILTCNFKATRWRGVELDIGESIKCLETLAIATGLSVQNIRTSIKHLKSTGELTERKQGKYRILKLKNYTKYQVTNTETNSELTGNQQGTNNRVRKKERKNEKNISKDITAKAVYGNKDVNGMLIALKETIGIQAFADSKIERNMAKHCVNLLGKIGRDEFKRRLEFLLADEFTAKNCNKIKFIYNNIKAFKEPNNQIPHYG